MTCLAFKKLTVYTVSMLLTFGPDLSAYAALPGGGKITSGKGSISVSGSTETIKQLSPTMSIDWKSFNIGQGNTVNFKLPRSSSVVSNFVSGTSASQIAGIIDSNGKVFIFNPFGLVFLKSSSINVGSFLASGLSETSAISTKMTLSGTGSVSNAGTITVAPGGYVSLVGQNVTNTGAVNALSGLITFGAGNSVDLDFSGNALLGLNVQSNSASSTINQSGVLTANGGTITLKAGTATSLAASAVNDSGLLEAETLNGVPGAITLKAGMKAGTETLSGVINASAPNGGNGGSITINAGTLNMDITKPLNVSSAYGQNGTTTIDPYSVSFGTAAGLENMDTDQFSYLADQITLTNNINLTGSGGVLYSWQPFGTSASPFTGSFNGKGYTVSGYTIGTSSSPNTAVYTGFFGEIGSTSVVENLGVAGSVYNVNSYSSVGGLVGYNKGGEVLKSYATGSVVGDGNFVGGLVGNSGGSIIDSYSTSTVEAKEISGLSHGGLWAGGLLGNSQISGTISNSFATGSVTGIFAGGLVSSNYGSVTSSYSNGNVTGSYEAGGLAEWSSGSIKNSYSTGNVAVIPVYSSFEESVGGLVANASGSKNSISKIVNSYATGSISGKTTYSGALVGYSNSDTDIYASYATNGNTGSGSLVGGTPGVNTGKIESSLSNLENSGISGTSTWSWGGSPWLNHSSAAPTLVFSPAHVSDTELGLPPYVAPTPYVPPTYYPTSTPSAGPTNVVPTNGVLGLATAEFSSVTSVSPQVGSLLEEPVFFSSLTTVQVSTPATLINGGINSSSNSPVPDPADNQKQLKK